MGIFITANNNNIIFMLALVKMARLLGPYPNYKGDAYLNPRQAMENKISLKYIVEKFNVKNS